ncbi:hypothetical protein HK104_005360 [Borealophlyctis nickersoniae]|nr:hypothetical protein HK104_005360 [Borealophlyctis nickersoniae]
MLPAITRRACSCARLSTSLRPLRYTVLRSRWYSAPPTEGQPPKLSATNTSPKAATAHVESTAATTTSDGFSQKFSSKEESAGDEGEAPEEGPRQPAVSKIVEIAGETLGAVVGSAAGSAQKATKAAQETVETVAEEAGTVAQAAAKAVKEAGEKAAGVVSEVVEKAATEGAVAAEKVLDTVSSAASAAGESVKSVGTETMGKAVDSVKESLKAGAESIAPKSTESVASTDQSPQRQPKTHTPSPVLEILTSMLHAPLWDKTQPRDLTRPSAVPDEKPVAADVSESKEEALPPIEGHAGVVSSILSTPGANGALDSFVDPLVQQFVGSVMKDGKKVWAQNIITQALTHIRKETGQNPNELLLQAVEKCAPLVKLRTVKRGGRGMQVPVPLNERQRRRQAIMWILAAATPKGDSRGPKFGERIGTQVLNVLAGKSTALQKQLQVHKLALANRSNVVLKDRVIRKRMY